MIVLASFSCAYSIQTRNAYSFENIQGAIVQIDFMNESTAASGVTDSEGVYDFSQPFNDWYSITLSKAGYNGYAYTEFVNSTTNDKIVYLTYDSLEVSRFRVSDRTLFGVMPVCFFYNENGRLKGCYYGNDTIILNAGNYSLYPAKRNLDYLTSFSGMGSLLILLIPTLLLLGLIALLILYLLSKFLKKIRGP